MMAKTDTHLGTGDYEPEKYWSARARNSQGDDLKAVGAFTATRMENRSMNRVQRFWFGRALKIIGMKRPHVLEYGCGLGRWADLFMKRGFSWTGVDISADMLALASRRWPAARLEKVKDGFLSPFPDSNFDLVYSITVLHHNEYERQEKIIREMSRVLKGGGAMILLEDLGGRSSFNMFARNKESWLGLAAKHRLRNVWYRSFRYWPVREAAWAGKMTAGPVMRKVWKKVAGPLDYALDPWLAPLISCRYPTAAIMAFIKREEADYFEPIP